MLLVMDWVGTEPDGQRQSKLVSQMAGSWDEIWESRQLDPSARSTLSALLAADGFDTPTARLSEADWVHAIDGIVDRIELNANGSVFEVGCGAGAFLYVLYTRGYMRVWD